MQLAILRSGGDTCDACGQYPAIAILRHPKGQPEELRANVYQALDLQVGWWRPFKRRWAKSLTAKLEQTEQHLIDSTIYPVA